MFPRIQRLAVVAFAIALGACVHADDNIIDEHIKAVGGTKALAKIKTMEREGKVKTVGEFGQFDGTLREAIVNGKKAYSAVDLGALAKSYSWNGKAGWTKKRGVTRIEKHDLEVLKMSAWIDPIVAIKEQYGLKAFKAAGEKKLDGKTYDTIEIVDSERVFFLDKKTRLIAATTSKSNDPNLGGEVVTKTTYHDYKAVEGVQLPHKTVTVMVAVRASVTKTYTKTAVNQPIDDKLFEKPKS